MMVQRKGDVWPGGTAGQPPAAPPGGGYTPTRGRGQATALRKFVSTCGMFFWLQIPIVLLFVIFLTAAYGRVTGAYAISDHHFLDISPRGQSTEGPTLKQVSAFSYWIWTGFQNWAICAGFGGVFFGLLDTLLARREQKH